MDKLGTVIVLPDTHCGSSVGLTPPQFESVPEDKLSAEYKMYLLRRGLYSWFSDEIQAIGHVDGVIGLGDLIEGKGRKNAGADNLASDRTVQVKMATAILRTIGAQKVFMVRGTPYHVGDEEQWEDVIAEFVEADIADNVFLSVYGHTIYARHKIGKAGAPTGWATAPARELTWNVINESTQKHPNADLMLYAHIHEFTTVGKWGKVAVTCPALQLPATSFGLKNMSGNYDVGFLQLDFYEGEKFDLIPHLYPVTQYAPQIHEFLS